MTTMEVACSTCGTRLRESAKFCDECGSAVPANAEPAEYKQVTVLFADVVHSMDIAAAVGAERLREIMATLVERAARVVQRYGGTVDKFTGDGMMALFGAPVALEDHAFRACVSALVIQEAVNALAADVKRRDGLDLQLRVGLNSGEVIAGQVGSSSFGYTAIGEQVGMAQRMESAARVTHGIMLIRCPGGDPLAGAELVAHGRRQAAGHANLLTVAIADVQLAEFEAARDNLDGSIETGRATVNHLFECGEAIFRGPATAILVEALLRRRRRQDLREARELAARLAACPTDPGFTFYELALRRLHTRVGSDAEVLRAR